MHWLQWPDSGPIKMKPREFLSDNWVQLSLGPNRNSYDPFGQLQTDQLFAAEPIQIICLLIKTEFNWAGLWSVAGHWPKYLVAKLWFGVSLQFQVWIYDSFYEAKHIWMWHHYVSPTSFHIEMVANSLFDVVPTWFKAAHLSWLWLDIHAKIKRGSISKLKALLALCICQEIQCLSLVLFVFVVGHWLPSLLFTSP